MGPSELRFGWEHVLSSIYEARPPDLVLSLPVFSLYSTRVSIGAGFPSITRLTLNIYCSSQDHQHAVQGSLSPHLVGYGFGYRACPAAPQCRSVSYAADYHHQSPLMVTDRRDSAATIDIPDITIPDISLPDFLPTKLPIPADLTDILPDSVQSRIMNDATYAANLIQSIREGDAPDWVSSLPDDKQSSLSSAASKFGTYLPSVSAQPTPSAGGKDDSGSSGNDDSDSSGDGTSTGAAPRATGAVAAGFAGIAGILGLAAAL